MTPLDKVRDAHRLSSGKELTGSNPYSGFCPAHHDRKRSLSISVNDDGEIGIHCHTGCDTERDVLRAWGMEFRDLYPLDGDKSPGTVIDIVKEITVEEESRPTKLVDVYESFKVWVDGLPDDDEDPSRGESFRGWKCGWIQILREWDSVVSLAGHRVRKSPNQDRIDIAGVIFAGCRAAAVAYRTRHGAWDPGAGAMLLTYARDWHRTGVLAAMGAEIKNQLNGGDTGWPSSLKEAGMPPPEVEPEDVAVDVPQAIPAPERICLTCHADISHLRIDARFCTNAHGNTYRDRVSEDADDLLLVEIGRLQPLPLEATEVQQQERRMINIAAKAIERLRAQSQRDQGVLRLNPEDWGLREVKVIANIRYENHLKHRHLMKSTYEENMQRPAAPDDKKGTG